MARDDINALDAASFIEPDWPAPESVKAYVTTRLGGRVEKKAVKKAEKKVGEKEADKNASSYDSFNLALHVNDDAVTVRQNRSALARHLKLDERDFCWLEQVHGTEVYKPERHLSVASGFKNNASVVKADACFVDHPQRVSVVMTADCLPVLFCNRQGTQVASAHAGWRGLCEGVLEQTLACFDEPSEVLAWMGPAIGPKHFEVGEDVYRAFTHLSPQAAQAFQAGHQPGKYFANLYTLATLRLNAAGVTEVFGGGLCTYEDAENFYSFRRDGARSGRMASLIYLRS